MSVSENNETIWQEIVVNHPICGVNTMIPPSYLLASWKAAVYKCEHFTNEMS